MNDVIACLYRQESRRVFSTLVRLPGSFEARTSATGDPVPLEEQDRNGAPIHLPQ